MGTLSSVASFVSLYGENSAPRRWEDTYSPYLESESFVRGYNDRSIFWHPERDVVDLTYVDDNCLDGEEAEVAWATDTINERFDCKDLDWVPMDGVPIDYLGMLMSMDSERTFLEMYVYIQVNNALEIMGWSNLKPQCG